MIPSSFFFLIVVLRTVFLWSPGNHYVVQAYLKPAEIFLSLTEVMGCTTTASLLPPSLPLSLSVIVYLLRHVSLCSPACPETM